MKESNCSPKTIGGTAGAEAKARWNPYLVGIGIGVLSWFAFGLVNQPLGISTALSSVSSVCALPAMGSEGVAQNAYWAKNPLKWDGGIVEARIQSVAALGKVRLPDITGVPDWGWFVILSAIGGVVFWLVETKFEPTANAPVPAAGDRQI